MLRFTKFAQLNTAADMTGKRAKNEKLHKSQRM
jgi:hypothetical protein